MKVSELLQQRQRNWAELQSLCLKMESRSKRRLGASAVTRFGSLYRAACADLALADAYQLPPNTVQYLHQLVGRAHNQLYRSRKFNVTTWSRELLYGVPRKLFADGYLRVAAVLFFGIFIACMGLAYTSPEFAKTAVGEENLEAFRAMYETPLRGQEMWKSSSAAGGYVYNNTGIGLETFSAGLIFGVGGLFILIFNAMYLGSVFGYMFTTPMSPNFFEFVQAHGPFELTAIVLSAAAGMRLGFSMIDTHGLARGASLRQAAREVMPVIGSAMVMFALAAFIEGYISPSAAPKWFKSLVCGVSAGLLLFYFVLLGIPPQPEAPEKPKLDGSWDAAVSEED